MYFFLFLFSFFSYQYSNVKPPLLLSPEKPESIKNAEIESFEVEDSNLSHKNKKKTKFIRWGAKSLVWEKKGESKKSSTLSLNFGWIKHEKTLLKANKLQIIGRQVDKAILKNNIRIEDKTNQILLKAGFGVYEKAKSIVKIQKSPRFYSTNKRNFFSVSSLKIVRELNKKQTLFETDVNFTGKEYTILCEKAKFIEEEAKIVTDAFPYFFFTEGFLTGKNFIYWNKEKKAILQNQVRGFFLSFEEPNNSVLNVKEQSKQKQRNISYLEADKIVFQRFSEKEKNLIQIQGNTLFEKNKIEFKSNSLTIYGSGADKIESLEYSEILDKNNHLKLSGNKFEYFKNDSYIHLTNNSKIDFFDKEKERKVQSTVYAVEIERFLDKKETVLRGDLKIESGNIVITGEYATYYDEEEKIVIRGNPIFTQKKVVMKVGKVIVYPKEQKVILSDNIRLK